MCCHFDQFPEKYLALQCLRHSSYSEMVHESINGFCGCLNAKTVVRLLNERTVCKRCSFDKLFSVFLYIENKSSKWTREK